VWEFVRNMSLARLGLHPALRRRELPGVPPPAHVEQAAEEPAVRAP